MELSNLPISGLTYTSGLNSNPPTPFTATASVPEAPATNAQPSESNPSDQLSLPATGAAQTHLDLGQGNERNLKARIEDYHSELKARRPELIEKKYAAMKESPFAFFRASAFLFYQDLKNNPLFATSPKTALHGDCHLENLGTYRTGDSKFAYDINDFDEAVSGPVAWDLARLATSIHLAAGPLGYSAEQKEQLVNSFLQNYAQSLDKIAKDPGSLTQILDQSQLTGIAAKQVDKAQSFDRKVYLAEMVSGNQFKLGKKLFAVSDSDRKAVMESMQTYAQGRPEGSDFYKVKDVAERVAGKGSLGLYRNVVLIEGPTASPDDDLILELKEARQASATQAGIAQSDHNAERIVAGYQQALPGIDPYLGTTRLYGQAAYVRELLPKETVNLEKLTNSADMQSLLENAALIMARTHSRAANGSELKAYVQQNQSTLVQFAKDYAAQTQADYQSFAAPN